MYIYRIGNMAMQWLVLQVQSQRLHVLPVSAGALFRYSGFLLQFQNMHVRQIENSMLAVVVGASVFLRGPAINWRLAQSVTSPSPCESWARLQHPAKQGSSNKKRKRKRKKDELILRTSRGQSYKRCKSIQRIRAHCTGMFICDVEKRNT